jgi:hypothetical protein
MKPLYHVNSFLYNQNLLSAMQTNSMMTAIGFWRRGETWTAWRRTIFDGSDRSGGDSSDSDRSGSGGSGGENSGRDKKARRQQEWRRQKWWRQK